MKVTSTMTPEEDGGFAATEAYRKGEVPMPWLTAYFESATYAGWVCQIEVGAAHFGCCFLAGSIPPRTPSRYQMLGGEKIDRPATGLALQATPLHVRLGNRYALRVTHILDTDNEAEAMAALRRYMEWLYEGAGNSDDRAHAAAG